MTLVVFFISVWKILINELKNISFTTCCNCCRFNLLLGLNFIFLFVFWLMVLYDNTFEKKGKNWPKNKVEPQDNEAGVRKRRWQNRHAYNPGQTIEEHLRKLGALLYFAKLTRILPLRMHRGKGGGGGEGKCFIFMSYCVRVPTVLTRVVAFNEVKTVYYSRGYSL